MRKAIVAAITMMAVAVPSTAEANTVCEKAHGVREAVVKKHGKKAAGRNICRFGVKHSNGRVEKAVYNQKKRYLFALRRLNVRYAYLTVVPTRPKIKLSGTMRAKLKPVGLAQCIVHHESTYNRLAQNGQYKGLAQWSPEAWRRHGGLKYGATPHHASYEDQLLVLNNGLTRFGCRDWCPFDPC